jgi:hypothetical protein
MKLTLPTKLFVLIALVNNSNDNSNYNINSGVKEKVWKGMIS